MLHLHNETSIVAGRRSWGMRAVNRGAIGTSTAFLVPLGFFLGTSQPISANPLAPIWTGAYIGLDAGASWADFSASTATPMDFSRAALGGHIGYDVSIGSFVLGLEADARHASGSDVLRLSGGGTVLFSADWSGSLRMRVGTTVGPALLYATAGWGWTGATLSHAFEPGVSLSSSKILHGAVYGLGAEAYLLPSVTLRLELLRTDYAADGITFSGGIRALQDLDLGDTTIRAGVSIRFK